MFESSPHPYLLLDPSLTIVAVNDAYLQAVGVGRAEILGRHLFDAFPDNPDDATATGVRNLRASIERVLRTKRPDRMPVQRYDVRAGANGTFSERYGSPLNAPVLTPEGDLRYVIHHAEDVTDDFSARRVLLATEERFRTLLGRIPHIVWIMNARTEFTYFSQQFAEYTGLASTSLGLGRGYERILLRHVGSPTASSTRWIAWKR